MKNKLIKALVLTIALSLIGITGIIAVSDGPTNEYTDYDFKSGNAYRECMQAGDCGGYAWKIEGYENREYNTNSDEFDNEPIMEPDNATITIFGSDGYFFNWTSDQPVCTVIVKGGKGANIYEYDQSYGDNELTAPVNPKNGKLYEISHISFCYDSITYREWPDGGTLSVAYEDLPLTSGNDWDYNDLVVDIQTIGKTYNGDLTHLYFTFIPEDRTAAYRHMMNFSVHPDMFSEGGEYELIVDGMSMGTGSFAADDYLNVTIIADSSLVSYGMTMIMLNITFDAPFTFTFPEWNPDYYHGDGGNLFFDPYIKVLNTGQEIHVGDGRMITVPIDWMWPMPDGTPIYSLYSGVTDNSPNPPIFTNYWWTS